MARLPQVGGDEDAWGNVLNEYLLESHAADGTIKDGVVTKDTLASEVQETLDKADTAVQPDAVGAKVLLIDQEEDLPPGTPAGTVVIIKA